MERLEEVFPSGCQAISDLLQMSQQHRLWAIRIRREEAQKPGLIITCGLLGIMGGVQVGGTSDPFSSCAEKTGSSHLYQVVVEDASFDLVQMYGESFNTEPVSGVRKMTGCSLLYRGLLLCFACPCMEPASSKEISLTSRLKARAPHLRSSIV